MKAQPLIAAPGLKPTLAASTSSRTHWPASGKAPIGTRPAEPTAPATLHPFEDAAEDDEAGPTTPSAGSRTSIAGARAETAVPKVARPTPAPRAAAAGGDRVWIQAASLSSRDEANALGARLSKHGFHAVVLPGSGPKGKVYRVRVGPYHTEDEASHAVTKLSRQEKIREPWIVPDGK